MPTKVIAGMVIKRPVLPEQLRNEWRCVTCDGAMDERHPFCKRCQEYGHIRPVFIRPDGSVCELGAPA